MAQRPVPVARRSRAPTRPAAASPNPSAGWTRPWTVADPGLDDSALRPLRVQRAEAASLLAGDLTQAAGGGSSWRGPARAPHLNVWTTGGGRLLVVEARSHGGPVPIAGGRAVRVVWYAGHPQKAAAAWAAVRLPVRRGDWRWPTATTKTTSGAPSQLLHGLGSRARRRDGDRPSSGPSAPVACSRGPRATTRAEPFGPEATERSTCCCLIADGLRKRRDRRASRCLARDRRPPRLVDLAEGRRASIVTRRPEISRPRSALKR